MTERKRMSTTTGCLLALAVATFGGLMVAGVAVAVLFVMGPTWARQAFTEPAPLSSSHVASSETPRAITQRLVAGLHGETHTERLSGPDLTTLFRDQVGAMGQGGFTVRAGVVTADLSFDLTEPGGAPTWVNLHLVGSLTVERGWVTGAHLDALDVSGWQFGPLFTDDAELVSAINRSLANERAKDPGLPAKLDAIERLWVDGDAVALTVTPDGAPMFRAPE